MREVEEENYEVLGGGELGGGGVICNFVDLVGDYVCNCVVI